MDFEQVDYWPELCEIMDFSETNVYSTLHVCWGAQAGLYYHYGIRKELLPAKMFGVFEHRVIRPSNPLVRGCDEVFGQSIDAVVQSFFPVLEQFLRSKGHKDSCRTGGQKAAEKPQRPDFGYAGFR